MVVIKADEVVTIGDSACSIFNQFKYMNHKIFSKYKSNLNVKMMKNSMLTFTALLIALVTFQACDGGGSSSSTEVENTDVVSSGTYTGTADKVDADEKEIYVKTNDGKMLELYFTDQTKLTQNGQEASFDALAQGQNVQVQVEKKGQRLEPIAVEILN